MRRSRSAQLRRSHEGPDLGTAVLPAGIVVLTLLFLSTGPLSAEAGLRVPLDGRGDFVFVADLPVFPTDGSGARVDLAVRIDHDQLRPTDARGAWSRRVAVELKLARQGRVPVDTTQVFEVRGGPTPDRMDDRRVVPFELLEIRTEVPEGMWAVTVNAVVLGGDVRRARAQGVLAVPSVAELSLVSDPEFRIHGRDGLSLPHPERLYGVNQDTLEVYFETVTAASPSEEGKRGIRVTVRDPVYGGMDEELVWFEPAPGRSGHLYRLPLGSFPAGAYLLELAPTAEGARSVEAEFVVSWRIERALQDADEVLLEAALVLPADAYERFRKLPRAVQSQRMQEFWDRHDPTPGTAVNETQELFRERVEHARRFYGEMGRQGPLSDRGRVYVRYGEPSEIEVEVIPSGGGDLDAAIERVHDTHFIPLEGVIAREQENKTDIVGLRRPGRGGAAGGAVDYEVLRDRQRNQARIGEEGSFELWIYDGDGEPLFGPPVGWSEDIGLRFLFVDRLGNGTYQLDFSNLPTRIE